MSKQNKGSQIPKNLTKARKTSGTTLISETSNELPFLSRIFRIFFFDSLFPLHSSIKKIRI
jgi:hypothetical protein